MEGRLDGEGRFENGAILHFLDDGAHDFAGGRHPCAVFGNSEGAFLNETGGQLMQEVLHQRVESIVVGGSHKQNP